MRPRPLMFHRLAEHYDALVGDKDYRTESRRLEGLADRFVRSGGRTWLDVGCGTGRHLEFLRRTHRVVGVDVSPEMLRIARRRLPGARLVRGDMRTFHLGETFDVVSCLFSAIGHLRTVRDLRATFRNFAAHLRPGGLLIVEPWIDPSCFRSGFLRLVTHRTPDAVVARMSVSSRHGAHSIVRYHYLIGEEGRGVQHFEEVDRGLMVPRQSLLDLLSRAGLRPRFLVRGFAPGRGLLIARKPRR